MSNTPLSHDEIADVSGGAYRLDPKFVAWKKQQDYQAEMALQARHAADEQKRYSVVKAEGEKRSPANHPSPPEPARNPMSASASLNVLNLTGVKPAGVDGLLLEVAVKMQDSETTSPNTKVATDQEAANAKLAEQAETPSMSPAAPGEPAIEAKFLSNEVSLIEQTERHLEHATKTTANMMGSTISSWFRF